MSELGKPVDKNATKPIYILTILDPETQGFIYVKTRQDFFNIYETHIDIRGIVITKAAMKVLKKATEIDRSFGERSDQINLMIPLHNWVKAENICFSGLAQTKK